MCQGFLLIDVFLIRAFLLTESWDIEGQRWKVALRQASIPSHGLWVPGILLWGYPACVGWVGKRRLRSVSNVCLGHGAVRNSKCATNLPCLISSNCFILQWEKLRYRDGKCLYPRKINFLKGLCAPGDEITHWHHSLVAVMSVVSMRPSSTSLGGGGFWHGKTQ